MAKERARKTIDFFLQFAKLPTVITTIIMVKIGERLKAARQLRGLTLKQVQNRTGIDYVTIHKYESNKSIPKIDNAKKLADAYQLSFSELFDTPVISS